MGGRGGGGLRNEHAEDAWCFLAGKYYVMTNHLNFSSSYRRKKNVFFKVQKNYVFYMSSAFPRINAFCSLV